MRNLTMLTDLYQLTMMNGYFTAKMNNKMAAFDVFYRGSGGYSYAIVAGLEQVIEYINSLHFDDSDIDYLRKQNLFSESFLKELKHFKFTGDIVAIPEGTIVFPYEPILTVIAPLFQAQLVETAILTIINHQTLIATKARRLCECTSKPISEFGLRRAQGPDAGIFGARAAYIGGCRTTSNVLAGKEFNIPIVGTHSHSWVMSFKTELEAFRAYANQYPDRCLLLVDTYDTLKSGIPNAIKVFDELKAKGYKPLGIRLDSGDLAYLSKMARKMLDDTGHSETKIFVSNDIDEDVLISLGHQGAKIDVYGIGTKLITSYANASLGGVYKLCAIEEDGELKPKIKISNTLSKTTNPGIKKVIRIFVDNKAQADLVALVDEVIDESKPLVITHPEERWKQTVFENFKIRELSTQIFKNGKLVYKMPNLQEIAEYGDSCCDEFDSEYKRVINTHTYKVDLSEKAWIIKDNLLTKSRIK